MTIYIFILVSSRIIEKLISCLQIYFNHKLYFKQLTTHYKSQSSLVFHLHLEHLFLLSIMKDVWVNVMVVRSCTGLNSALENSKYAREKKRLSCPAFDRRRALIRKTINPRHNGIQNVRDCGYASTFTKSVKDMNPR